MRKFISFISKVYCCQEFSSWYLQQFGWEYQELQQHYTTLSQDAEQFKSSESLMDYEKSLFGFSLPEFFEGSCSYACGPEQRYFYLVGYFLENLQILAHSLEQFEFCWEKECLCDDDLMQIDSWQQRLVELIDYYRNKWEEGAKQNLHLSKQDKKLYESYAPEPRKSLVFRQSGPTNPLQEKRFSDLPQGNGLTVAMSRR